MCGKVLRKPKTNGVNARSCQLIGFPLAFRISVKEQILQAIHRLPDDIDYHDPADEIGFLAAVPSNYPRKSSPP
jgi:hypothetical protein